MEHYNYRGSKGIARDSGRSGHYKPKDESIVCVVVKVKITLIGLCIIQLSLLGIIEIRNRIGYGVAAGVVLRGNLVGPDPENGISAS